MEVALAVVEDPLPHSPVTLTLPHSLQRRTWKLEATAHVLALVVDASQPRRLMQVWSVAAAKQATSMIWRLLVQQRLAAKTLMT